MADLVKLNGIEYNLVEATQQKHRCGKTTTTLVLRRPTIDITVVAESSLAAVCVTLGLTMKETPNESN